MATVSHYVSDLCMCICGSTLDYCLLLKCLLVTILFFRIVSFDDKMEENGSLFPTDLDKEKTGAHQRSAAGHHMTYGCLRSF